MSKSDLAWDKKQILQIALRCNVSLPPLSLKNVNEQHCIVLETSYKRPMKRQDTAKSLPRTIMAVQPETLKK